jgi:diaminopimelate epimerase
MLLKIVKRHSLANAFIVVDLTSADLPQTILSGLASELANRKGPVGSDGVAFIASNAAGNVKTRVFNPSGQESELCLNGLRCLAASVLTPERRAVNFTTPIGDVWAESEPDLAPSVPCISLSIPLPKVGISAPFALVPLEWNAAGVHLAEHTFFPITNGVPHLISLVESISTKQLVSVGERLQVQEQFPLGVNVSFAAAVDGDSFYVRTFERGGAGLTRSCSSAINATAYLLSELGIVEHDRPLRALTNGGPSVVRRMNEVLVSSANSSTVFTAELQLRPDFSIEPIFRGALVMDEIQAYQSWLSSTGVSSLEKELVHA